MITTLATSDIPEKVIRESGFADWIVYALVVLLIADKVRSWVVPGRRDVSGKVQTEPVVPHAEQPDVDKLSQALATLTLTVNSNQSDLMLKGQERMSSIKDLLRTEVSAVMREVSTFKDALNRELGSVKERLASAETRLDNLTIE